MRFDFSKPAYYGDSLIKSIYRGNSLISFNPLSLFANGENGAWFDPSDRSTLYQDAAGTTPVAADGDPVGRMQDKSGNGNHATQSISPNRPVLRKTSGGLWYLEYNGTNSLLTAPQMVDGATGLLLSVGFTVYANDRFHTPISPSELLDDGAHFYLRKLNPRLAFAVTGGTGNLRGSDTLDISVPYIVSGVYKNSQSFLRQNGAELASRAEAAQAEAGGLTSLGFVSGVQQQNFEGRFFGAVLRSAATENEDIHNVESYLAAKSGVTL